MKLKKNQILDVEIIDITNLGFGVAKPNGEVLFISDAVVGDKIRAKVIKVSSGYAVGRVEEYLYRSDIREKRCEISACRACAYKSISYAYEAKIKEESVRQIFKKAGLTDVAIAPIVSSPRITSYRNKAQYPISMGKDGEYQIGFFAPKSHRVTDAVECPLAPKMFSEILYTLKKHFKENSVSVYDEESGTGLLRHVYIRRGEISGEILLTIVINGDSIPKSEELVAQLASTFPDIVGILLNENRKNTNVILGEKYTILYGKDYIFDTLAGVKLKITAPSFYQVNHDCAEILYAKARELAALSSDDLLLDLYCGAGSIGLSMAKDCREVIGIEIVESAVECAKFNAESNGISNAYFYVGDAVDTESLLRPAEKIRGEKTLPNVVILDPPRAGSDEKLLRHIASLSPERIVYVSCNPQTLARDAKIMRELGYTVGTVTPVDMFPGTGHVETVVLLSRKKSDDVYAEHTKSGKDDGKDQA